MTKGKSSEIVSKRYPDQKIRIEPSMTCDGVFINSGYAAHFLKCQVREIIDAIVDAVGGEPDKGDNAKPERVKYVNNTGSAMEEYVGQHATVVERTKDGDACLRFNDGRVYWVFRENVVPADSGTTSTAMFIAGYEFEGEVEKVFVDARNLLLKKHRDYGPTNISRSPGGPLNGLRVRIHDKTARLNNLIDSGAEPENESLRDTLQDLANYALIGILVLDGKWPAE